MNERFCGKCGERLDANGRCPNCDSYSGGQTGGQAGSQADKKKNIIIVVLAIVLVALVCIFVTYGVTSGMFSGNKEEETTVPYSEEVTETTTETTTEAPGKTVIIREVQPSTKATKQPTSYIYVHDDDYDDGYLFPSDTELITYDYLDTLPNDEIDLIRNEIYARHGYIFKKAKYYNYFITKTWYHPTESNMSNVEKQFNSTERKNIATLVKYQGL